MPAVNGAVETVEKLKDSNFRLGLVSSKKRFFIKEHLKQANFDINDFEAVVGAEDTEKNKPHPDPLIHACELMNVKPKEVIYIGDALVDFLSARQAGIKFIGVLSGGTDEEIFRKNGVENILKSVKELPNFLKIE
jgi:HAD superfamily hydrolase (TIGR01549 family)